MASTLRLPKELEPYRQLILVTAAKYGLDPALWAGVLMFESGGNASVVNQVGAVGLGQVMSREAGFADRPTIKELQDPATNLEWSARILSDGIRRYGPEGGVASYLGAVDPRTGRPTGAKDANGTDGFTYVRQVYTRAEQYGFDGTYTPNRTPMGLPRTGDGTVADTPEIKALTDRRDELNARLNANRAKLAAIQLVEEYAAAKGVPHDDWLKAKGITQKQLDDAFRLAGGTQADAAAAARAGKTWTSPTSPKSVQEQIDKDEEALARVRLDLGKAQTTAQNAAARGDGAPATRQGPDGSEYQWDAAQGTWVPAPGIAGRSSTQKPGTSWVDRGGSAVLVDTEGKIIQEIQKDRNLQVWTDPATNEVWTLDARTGQKVSKLSDGKPDVKTITGPDGRPYVLSQDGKTATPVEGIGPTVKTATVEGRVFYSTDDGRTFQQATGLPDPEPRDVSAPPGQQFIVRRRADGSMETVENPNYRADYGDPVSTYNAEAARVQAALEAKAADLQRRVDLEPEKADQYRAELTQWWQQNAGHLAGLRSAAERSRAQDQLALDAAQRQENQRAEGINRQREQYAYEQGSRAAENWRRELPAARSTAFVNEYAANVSRLGQGDLSAQGVRFTPEALTAPTPYVAPNAIAEREAARALAHISPAAAATIGAPLPELAPIPDLTATLPRFSLPAAAAS